MSYKILFSNSIGDLQDKVNKYIEKGYVVTGGVGVIPAVIRMDPTYFVQAVTIEPDTDLPF